MQEVRVKVARFLCSLCGLTVSVLPSFVLPYRNRLVKEVDVYFLAGDEQRRELANPEQLRRYWQQWVEHLGSLVRDTGWPPQRPVRREPREGWKALGEAAGGMEAAQRHLISRYGVSLLRRYRCHRRPRRSEC